jgi:hypothetical protein
MHQKGGVILYCQSDKQSNPNEKPRSKTYENPIQSKRKPQNPNPKKTESNPKEKPRSKNPNPNLPKTTGNPIPENHTNLLTKPENIAPLLRGIFFIGQFFSAMIQLF